MHAAAVRDRLDQRGVDGVGLILVTFTTADAAVDYEGRHRLGVPLLLDPDRRTYRAYGLGRGTVGRVWGLRAGLRYARLMIGGRRLLGVPAEDTLQLGGDFVIGADGTLAWGYWSEGPDDRPAPDAVVDAALAARQG